MCLNQDIIKKQIPFFIEDSDWLEQAPFIEERMEDNTEEDEEENREDEEENGKDEGSTDEENGEDEGNTEEEEKKLKLQNLFYKKESSDIIQITSNYNFVFNSFKSGSSLWIRNKTFWEDGSITYSEPLSNEQMRSLQITASKVDTIYTNSSIKQIVAEQNWHKNHIENQAAEINLMKDEINLRVTNDKLDRYFSFGEKGLIIREKKSSFSTLTDDKGFHIRYSLNQDHEQDAKILGSFDHLGLNTTEISLSYENEQISPVTVVARGTPTKGWAWTKGQSRVRNDEN